MAPYQYPLFGQQRFRPTPIRYAPLTTWVPSQISEFNRPLTQRHCHVKARMLDQVSRTWTLHESHIGCDYKTLSEEGTSEGLFASGLSVTLKSQTTSGSQNPGIPFGETQDRGFCNVGLIPAMMIQDYSRRGSCNAPSDCRKWHPRKLAYHSPQPCSQCIVV